jgi:predicted nucleic acid-binding protein
VKTRTFLDAGVLLALTDTKHPKFTAATSLINDPRRAFAASIYLQLETLPKFVYFKHRVQVEILSRYFHRVKYWPRQPEKLLASGFKLSQQYGLGGMDALHIAAVQTGCTEFFTTEKTASAIHRAKPAIKIITF